MNRILAALALVFLAGCKPSLWLVGDSITNLYCDEVAALRPGWRIVCLGVGGEHTEDMKARLEHDLTFRLPYPSVVVIEGGINDVADGLPAEDAIANLADMAAMVDNSGMAIPVLATTLYSDRCTANPEFGCLEGGPCPIPTCVLDAGICEQDDVTIVVNETIPGDEFADLLHPNQDGQDRIAQAIVAAADALMPPTTTTTTLP